MYSGAFVYEPVLQILFFAPLKFEVNQLEVWMNMWDWDISMG